MHITLRQSLTYLVAATIFVTGGAALWINWGQYKLVEASLNSACKAACSQPLQYASIERLDNQLILREAAVETDAGSMTAEQVNVAFALSYWPPQARIDVELVRPHLTLDPSAPSTRADAGWDLFSSNTWFPLDASVAIQDGLISLCRPGEEKQAKRLLCYGTIRANRITQAALQLRLGHARVDQDTISLHFEKTADTATLGADFHNVEAEDLYDIALEMGLASSRLSIQQGNIDGSLSLKETVNRPWCGVGDVGLHNVSVIDRLAGCKTHIGEAHLVLDTEEEELSGLSPTRMRLDLHRDISCTFLSDNTPFWKARDLSGNLAISPSLQRIDVNVTGQVERRTGLASLNIQGAARLNRDRIGSIDLKTTLSSRSDTTSAEIAAEGAGGEALALDIELRNFTAPDTQLVQTLLKTWNPRIADARVYGGRIDASISGEANNGHVTDLRMERIAASSLEMDLLPANVYVGCAELQGEVGLDLLSDNPLASLQADVTITEGVLKSLLEDMSHWDLTDINTNLLVRNGVVQQSSVEADLGGLRGSIELDWSAPSEVATIRFEGNVRDLPPVLPTSWKERLTPDMALENLYIQAHIHRGSPDGLLVDGQIELRNRPQVAPMLFGCEVAFDAENDEQPKLSKLDRKRIRRELPQILQQLCGGVGTPAASLHSRSILEESDQTGIIVRNGWISCERLPLAEYVSPLLFPESEEVIEGVAHLTGLFNQTSAVIEYGGKNLKLTGRNYTIECPSIGADRREGTAFGKSAVHYMDFLTGHQTGFIPIHHARYVHSSPDLHFQDVSGVVHILKSKVYADRVCATSDGMQVKGSVAIDSTDPRKGHNIARIVTESISGTSQQLATFLQRFNPNLLSPLPLEAHISSGLGGVELTFHNNPYETTVSGTCKGTLTDGKLTAGSSMTAIDKLNGDFAYSLSDDTLAFSGLTANLSLGTEGRQRHYDLRIPALNFTSLKNNVADIDIRVRSMEGEEVAGLACRTGMNGDWILAAIDRERTHLLGQPPKKASIELANWSTVNRLELEFHPDEQKFAREVMAHMGLYAGTLYGDTLLETAGNLTVEHPILSFLGGQGQWKLRSTTGMLGNQNTSFGPSQFTLSFAQDTINVDGMQVGPLSVASEIHPSDNGLNISFLGIRHDTLGMMGLEGTYDTASGNLEMDINLLEADLGAVAHAMPDQLPADIDGKLKATGSLSANLSAPLPLLTTRLDTTASVNGLRIGKWQFGKLNAGNLTFAGTEGWSATGVDTTVIAGARSIPLELREAHRELNGTLAMEGLRFSAPAQDLKWLSTLLRESFSDTLSEKVQQAIADLKTEETVSGELNLQIEPDDWSLEIELNDDTYQIEGVRRALSNVQIECRPGFFTVSSGCRWNNADLGVWLQGQTGQSSTTGRLVAVETNGDVEEAISRARLAVPGGSSAPLTVDWSLPAKGGCRISSAHGSLSGIDVDLHHTKEGTHSHVLQGTVHFNGELARNLMPKELHDGMRAWKVGEGFELEGNWIIPYEDLGAFSFEGALEAHNAKLKGTTLDHITANVEYRPGHFSMANLKIDDDAGILSSRHIEAWRDSQDEWFISAPHMAIENLRPSALKRGVERAQKPLTIVSCELEDLCGKLSDSTTLTGKGRLEFSNPNKRNFENTLLAIPNDIIARIGLDLDVLNPVAGSVFYHLDGGKIWLDEFKDVYSAGRVSKFYLPSDQFSSSVDFDGNLAVQVKMKQYNLLFKLAELFTVTINGNISKPNYGLQKQNGHTAAHEDDSAPRTNLAA